LTAHAILHQACFRASNLRILLPGIASAAAPRQKMRLRVMDANELLLVQFAPFGAGSVSREK
jgi:hypothetical protein